MSMIAEAQGVDTILYDVVMNNLFDPYHYVTVREIYEQREHFEWQDFIRNKIILIVLSLFSEVLG
jgi:hypothetical protein